MPSSRKKTRRRPGATPSDKTESPLEGNPWRDEIRDRLRKYIKDNYNSNADFASEIGVDPARVSEWLNPRENLPGQADTLRAFGETAKARMSLDWLFFGVGQPLLAQSLPPSTIHSEVGRLARSAFNRQLRAAPWWKPWSKRSTALVADDDERVGRVVIEKGVSQLLGEVRRQARLHVERSAPPWPGYGVRLSFADPVSGEPAPSLFETPAAHPLAVVSAVAGPRATGKASSQVRVVDIRRSKKPKATE